VFDPYFTTKRGGTGLGLPIAKHVVEGLGGTISVSTVPGRGTEVRIELPVSGGEARAL
jgi:signal transduction histidine kinase